MSCSKDADVSAPRYDKARLAQDLAVYAVTDSTWLDGRALEDVVAQAIQTNGFASWDAAFAAFDGR